MLKEKFKELEKIALKLHRKESYRTQIMEFGMQGKDVKFLVDYTTALCCLIADTIIENGGKIE